MGKEIQSGCSLFTTNYYGSKFQLGGTLRDLLLSVTATGYWVTSVPKRANLEHLVPNLHTRRIMGVRELELWLTRKGTPLKALWLVVQEEVDFLMSGSLSSLKLFLWLLENLFCGCWYFPPSFLLFGVHCVTFEIYCRKHKCPLENILVFWKGL